MKSFKVWVEGKELDYRIPGSLDLASIQDFFSKRYKVKKIWEGGRHILGILEKDGEEYFVKVATSQGINVLTENEAKWNEEFNKQVKRGEKFWVPQNFERGYYHTNFYLITDLIQGEPISDYPENFHISQTFQNSIDEIIELAKLIQELNLPSLNTEEDITPKVQRWFDDIPEEVKHPYQVIDLLKICQNLNTWKKASRHGDFTPWHLVRLANEKLGLLDGEHAKGGSIEGYDISYFIQRVFSVLKDPEFAKEILMRAIKSGYSQDKLRIALATRAIGGFLDESLTENPDYNFAEQFKNWVLQL